MEKEEIPHLNDVPDVKPNDNIKYLPHFLYDIKDEDYKIGKFLGYENSYGCRLEHGEHSHIEIQDENGIHTYKCEHEIKHIKYYNISKMRGDEGRKYYGEKILKV